MDSKTLLVLIIDGGLVLFFLYALYYISKLSPSTIDSKPITKQDKEKPSAIKVKDYEPTYTPSPAIVNNQVEETTEIHDKEIPNTIISQYEEEKEVITREIDPDNIELPKSTSPSETSSTEVPDPVAERLNGINIIDVEGIGPVYETRLNNIGINTVGDLLSEGATPSGRKIIVDETGISRKLVLEWVNICDLFRISGVGEEYSDLLEEAGVDTVPELARRNPMNLHTKLTGVNEDKNLVRRLPSLTDVTRWVEEAKKLPRVIEY